MALADMYKQNNVSYYESGQGMSGVFTDTIENLTANGMIDDSIFLNTGSTWAMKNTGTIGNHFAWYADWVGGVLAVRKGPDVVSITYLGSAILSKNTSCTVASLSAKQADGAGWADFKKARFMIDAIQATPGTASQYNAFNYAAYSGQKYGFNSCFIQSTAGYATSNTAHNYTAINDYTALTGDNAKRIVYSNYQVMLTNYNPYLADNDTLGKYNVGYIWDFFNIGGEIVCVRDMLRMPNSAHWQSWAYYHDVTDKYVTIGGFGGNVVAGTQGALPESDDVKGIFSYNNSGTSANWFTTKNAVDYKTNSMGLRWCVGNNTISTAKQWRDNVRLGVMAASGIITHNQWITGEAAIQASDNPNKNTDYDHIPGHGGGGGGTPGEWDDMPGAGSSIGALAGARCYICSKTDITNLKNWMSKTEADGGPPDGYDVLSSLISVMAFPIDMSSASSGPATAISFTGLRTATDNQLVNIATALLSIANSVGAVPKTEIKTFTSTATALPSAGNPFTIDLGTCDCPTFYSSDFPFADYDASVELYLPFIGTMSLDTQTVMGKSLHAYMSVDPITGAIYAWCECNKDGSRVVIASGSGAIGVNTPITANQVGMAMAQIKNNAAQTRQTAIQSALTLGVGAFAGMDKNISSILSRNMTQAIGQRSANIAIATGRDYMDALSVGASQAAMTAIPNAIGANLNSGRANRQIAQANHNSVTGSAGGSTADWSCSYTPYLKVITPDIHRAGEQYEHTYGVPTIQSGTLSSFSGLTFCANPDVSSISTATDQEKQQIFGLLTGGVYV